MNVKVDELLPSAEDCTKKMAEAEGKLGKKSGEGFYRWSEDGKRL